MYKDKLRKQITSGENNMKSTIVILTFFVLGLSACATNHTKSFQSAVMQRAPFDLSCEANEISLNPLGSDVFGVTGCGQKVTYACICKHHVMGDCTKPLCEMDAASKAN
jgi:hypothetical protein